MSIGKETAAKIFTVPEAIEFQLVEYGRVVLGRDALYASVRSGRLPAVRTGSRRIFIPKKRLVELLEGTISGLEV